MGRTVSMQSHTVGTIGTCVRKAFPPYGSTTLGVEDTVPRCRAMIMDGACATRD